MFAKILTSRDPIKTGHKMDIYHASSSLPYVDIFITDNYMKNLIRKLKLDEMYNTKVLYIGDINELEIIFNKIQ